MTRERRTPFLCPAVGGYNGQVGFSDAPSRILFDAPQVAEPSLRGVGVLEGSAP